MRLLEHHVPLEPGDRALVDDAQGVKRKGVAGYTSKMLRRLIDSPWFLWLLLALPGAGTIIRYATGATFYGEVVHSTGQLSAQLLIVTMAVLAALEAYRLWKTARNRSRRVAA